MNNSLTIILGVISGIISSIVMIFYLTIWSKIFKPWLKNFIYRDISIDGDWIGNGKDEFGEYTLHIHMDQIAEKISGNVNRVQDNKIEMKYKYFGIVKNSMVNIIYTEHDTVENRFDVGNFLGRIESGGTKINGILSYLSNINNDKLISVNDFLFNRVNSGQIMINGFEYIITGSNIKKQKNAKSMDNKK